jgi:hypothetical protein
MERPPFFGAEESLQLLVSLLGGVDPPRRTLYVGAPGNPPCTHGPTTFTIGRIHTRVE